MRYVLLFLALTCIQMLSAQDTFTRQDTLRGSITPERAWWDLNYYHLDITVDPEERTITGTNLIRFKVLEPHQTLQVDMQPPMMITKVEQDGKTLKVKQDGNAWFVNIEKALKPGSLAEILVHYEGKPIVAQRPPWDAVLTWEKDNNGKHFIATSCQGEGASMWWPCKDHMYDEPDSMLMSVTVPGDLYNVSNGRLRGIDENKDQTRTFHWAVVNPINSYGVNINIGDYVYFGEKYEGEKGTLDMDYYVLRDNLEKAKAQFKDARRTMEAFEHWFGPYPFYEDSYKLVEVPYLGMEHQSSVTYGNDYLNGYRGMDLSGSGWGLKFDFIIIHETGHEWFANNITYKDIADMWVHEGFTAYSENLYLDFHFGEEAGAAYTRGTRSRIQNDRPIVGPYDVNRPGSGDMYYKGANLLHMLRKVINDDDKWRNILRGLNETFYHQTVTTKEIEDYMIKHSGIDLATVFDQYLRDTRIPILQWGIRNGTLQYKWSNCVEGFDLPVNVYIDGEETMLKPSPYWKNMKLNTKEAELKIDPDFYVGSMDIFG